ncbi:hypothetical protein [Acidovorax sp. Root70]|uniref:hypothetical protein n=1 Tax=Acidovorax sp. Root70 TaxID=1736590 RepID=UPI0006F23E02|nr:hypothetical protein [Acidovorax sp. Root70]KRB33384.1 hypothetical protein ASD94_22030 [Acidovorax sp. Root70]
MTDKTDSKERDLMALVDAYAEARHIGGCHTYNAKTAEARAKVVASLAANAGSEPVAWRYRSGANGNWEDCTKEAHDMVLRAPQRWTGYEAQSLYSHPSPPEGMVAEQALRKVLSVVQRYLPPDGPTAHDAMTEITEIVDPWPLGPLEKP